MRNISRPISLSLYVLVLLCFLLPFARVSCSSSETKNGVETKKVETIFQANGYEIAFGKRIPEVNGETWEPEARRPDFLAIALLVATLVGVGMVLIRGRRGAIVRALYSEHCLLLAVALWARLVLRVDHNGGALTMLAGYWVTLALFAVAVVVNFIAIWFLPRTAPPPAQPGIDAATEET
jgi:hypothetical protein